MLEIKALNKTYFDRLGSRQVLFDVNLAIGPGEIVGLFGENGAGKTTLMKSILGFLSYQGEILLDGKPIDRSNIARLSFATCEHSFFPNLTPDSHAEFYGMHFGRFRGKRYETLMEFFELPRRTALKGYSTGQKNQFEVIMALCQGAEYILMDEPFAALDYFTRAQMQQELLKIYQTEQKGILFVHSSHRGSGAVYRTGGAA